MRKASRRLNELMDLLRREAPQEIRIYVVGGAVRDILREQPVHDLDLLLDGEVRPLARRVANRIHGDFYMMDEKRDTARVIDHSPDGGTIFIDFCVLRAPDLETDLRERDFTVNAIAFDLRHPEQIIDPTGGEADLRQQELRACSPQAFERDPVRVLRGVRLALNLGFRIQPDTFEWMHQAVILLPRVSRERQRDELFRMLESGRAPGMVSLLDRLGALDPLLPELMALKDVSQSTPHILDVWQHTLAVLAELEGLWTTLITGELGETSDNIYAQAARQRLGRYRERLAHHFSTVLNPNRSLRGLVFLAALYHDSAKPLTRSVEPGGRIHFLRHEAKGAELVASRGRMLALSQVEIQRLEVIVSGHMRVHQIAAPGEPVTRRAIFHFFRDAGPTGIEIILLSLADTLATYGGTLPMPFWEAELETARALMEAWFDQPAKSVRPPRLLTGEELLGEFHLSPGPAVGRLLVAVQEAQAAGEITTRQQALDFVKTNLARILADSPPPASHS